MLLRVHSGQPQKGWLCNAGYLVVEASLEGATAFLRITHVIDMFLRKHHKVVKR